MAELSIPLSACVNLRGQLPPQIFARQADACDGLQERRRLGGRPCVHLLQVAEGVGPSRRGQERTLLFKEKAENCPSV